MPPIRSVSVGFNIRLSRLLPWAVPISCTPRSAIVRAAIASASVPISSITITSGMWFSTASIITRCCRSGALTCMRRALPIAGCGMSPSPAISLEVSTTTTRLLNSEARTRAASRSMVVLPTPGRPMIRIERPASMWSRRISIVPKTERPTRQVRPTTRSDRLRIAEMRWSVRSMPARLSPPKLPMREITQLRSSSVTSRSSSVTSPEVRRASGRRPRSMTISRRPSRPAASSSRVARSRIAATISPGRQARSRSRLSTIASS